MKKDTKMDIKNALGNIYRKEHLEERMQMQKYSYLNLFIRWKAKQNRLL